MIAVLGRVPEIHQLLRDHAACTYIQPSTRSSSSQVDSPSLPNMVLCTQCYRDFAHEQALHAHCRDKTDHPYCTACERLFVHDRALEQVDMIYHQCNADRSAAYVCSRFSIYRIRLPIKIPVMSTRKKPKSKPTRNPRAKNVTAMAAQDGLSQGRACTNTSPAAPDTTGVSCAPVTLEARPR